MDYTRCRQMNVSIFIQKPWLNFDDGEAREKKQKKLSHSILMVTKSNHNTVFDT